MPLRMPWIERRDWYQECLEDLCAVAPHVHLAVGDGPLGLLIHDHGRLSDEGYWISAQAWGGVFLWIPFAGVTGLQLPASLRINLKWRSGDMYTHFSGLQRSFNQNLSIIIV